MFWPLYDWPEPVLKTYRLASKATVMLFRPNYEALSRKSEGYASVAEGDTVAMWHVKKIGCRFVNLCSFRF